MHDLFPNDHLASDTAWFRRLQNPTSEACAAVRRFCEQAHDRLASALDRDFGSEFRINTPHRFSELFFGEAFLRSGFELSERVVGFDFAFVSDSGRILVEVITPNPPPRSSWEEEEHDGFRFYSMDGDSRDASLLQLIGALKTKAEIVAGSVSNGHAKADDFKIVAISGLRTGQEGGWHFEGGGLPPDFSGAFLPIGGLQVTVKVPRMGSGPLEWGNLEHAPRSQIVRRSRAPVDHDTFVSGEYPHVDAVAYAPMHFGDLTNPDEQISLVVNPTRSGTAPIPNAKLGALYTVDIGADEFSMKCVG